MFFLDRISHQFTRNLTAEFAKNAEIFLYLLSANSARSAVNFFSVKIRVIYG